MDLTRLVNMIMRIVMRKAVNMGINRAMGAVARPPKAGEPAKPMTAAERQQAKEAREMARRARQAARLTRRIGKF